ncbi:ABC transporter substrate-binding protein [Nocardia altamirensis]|uniref:ABC transporter substrate-binding protein n=1 Tax=Nocardia altamirensis TaxID=472158 RepID=UPI0009FDB5B5|nr:ABC transporter substrate-binding protein [Nocardia altamirensis]
MWSGARVATLVVSIGALVYVAATCTSPTRDVADRYESITVHHTMGTTTIDRLPKKVVTLGDQWTANTLALGVTPIGAFAPLPGTAPPWLPKLEPPSLIDPAGNVIAQIAARQPDLILLDGMFADRKNYDDLAGIAPTVAGLTGGWQEQLPTLGRILGKQQTADKLVNQFDKALADIVAAVPKLHGATYCTSWLTSDTQLLVLAGPNDDFGGTLPRLGLHLPEPLATKGRMSLPPNQIHELSADVLLLGYSPGLADTYPTLPGYTELPAARKGSVVLLTTEELAALQQPTALSAPYLLEKLKPALTLAMR